jgi:hypothetical protein
VAIQGQGKIIPLTTETCIELMKVDLHVTLPLFHEGELAELLKLL